MKHTKGPWIVGHHSQNGQYILDKDGEEIVAETYPDDHQDFEANATLISACPEMLEALEKFQNCFPNGTGAYSQTEMQDALKFAHSVIKKARGES